MMNEMKVDVMVSEEKKTKKPIISLLVKIIVVVVILVMFFVFCFGGQNEVKKCENLESSIKDAVVEYVNDKRNDSVFISKVQSKKVRIKGSDLITNKNLSDEIINPFDDSEIVTDSIVIEISLNDDYTAKEVIVYRDKNEDNYINSSVDDEKFSCNKDWWVEENITVDK